jgi:prephenate dehydrogenase
VSAVVVGIVGTGLIGGSIGLRARELGFATIGYDPSDAAARAALAAGVIDEYVARGELLARADIVAIAAPVDGTIGEIAALRESPPIRASLVLDVASVKAPIVHAARGLANFVATHPMAGSEASGASAARADLFDGRNWLYVPPGNATVESKAQTFIESMGATPVAVDAQEHDRIVALTSHVPQLIAFAFARRVRDLGPAAEPMYGPVARELLRIGKSNPGVWDSILKANGANVSAELRLLLDDVTG